MSDIAIRVNGLSKLYHLGATERYRTLRETLTDTLLNPFRNLRRRAGPREEPQTLWALKDISFEVKQGEVIGIIGRNGAGKSTLLKILSRITEPTHGNVEIRGRVGSLLEVGTGFHPELSGRENIFLNGAILGMKNAEILRKFDEIVAFAEVDKFIDTPVKHYSSGMYVRLAFAVAAHMETEVLLVDEVLAVGDAEFQRKCLNKMKMASLGGRTIVLISHNMSAVRLICTRGIGIDGGRLADDGDTNQVVDAYLTRLNYSSNPNVIINTKSFIVERVVVKASRGQMIKTFDDLEIAVDVTAKVDIGDPGLYVGILASDGTRVAGLDLKDFQTLNPIEKGKSARLSLLIEAIPLLPGAYEVELHLKDMRTHSVEFVAERFPFEIAESPVYGARKLDAWYGLVGFRAHFY